MNSNRIRSLHQAIQSNLESATEEAAKDRNNDTIFFIDEALELLQVLIDEVYEYESSELDFE